MKLQGTASLLGADEATPGTPTHLTLDDDLDWTGSLLPDVEEPQWMGEAAVATAALAADPLTAPPPPCQLPAAAAAWPHATAPASPQAWMLAGMGCATPQQVAALPLPLAGTLAGASPAAAAGCGALPLPLPLHLQLSSRLLQPGSLGLAVPSAPPAMVPVTSSPGQQQAEWQCPSHLQPWLQPPLQLPLQPQPQPGWQQTWQLHAHHNQHGQQQVLLLSLLQEGMHAQHVQCGEAQQVQQAQQAQQARKGRPSRRKGQHQAQLEGRQRAPAPAVSSVGPSAAEHAKQPQLQPQPQPQPQPPPQPQPAAAADARQPQPQPAAVPDAKQPEPQPQPEPLPQPEPQPLPQPQPQLQPQPQPQPLHPTSVTCSAVHSASTCGMGSDTLSAGLAPKRQRGCDADDASTRLPAKRGRGERYTDAELAVLQREDPRRYKRILSTRKSVAAHRARAKEQRALRMRASQEDGRAAGSSNLDSNLLERLRQLEEENRSLRAQLLEGQPSPSAISSDDGAAQPVVRQSSATATATATAAAVATATAAATATATTGGGASGQPLEQQQSEETR